VGITIGPASAIQCTLSFYSLSAFERSHNESQAGYNWLNTSDNLQIYDGLQTAQNTYIGGAYQQTISALSLGNQTCYQLLDDCYAIYAFEYQPGFNNGYVTWVSNNQRVMTVQGAGFAADPATQVGARAIPQEPMVRFLAAYALEPGDLRHRQYIIMNLAMSVGFSHVIHYDQLTFPATMLVDHVRVYQPPGAHNIGCDPEDFPTMDYINTYVVP
jgi:beta-glucanase (GH16 family)